MSNNIKVSKLINLRQCPNRAQCTLRSRANLQTNFHELDLPYVWRKHQQACYSQVANLNRLRSKIRRFAQNLCRLPKAKRFNLQILLSAFPHDQVHWLVRKSTYLLNLSCELQLLASGYQRSWPQKTRPYQSSRPVPARTDNFRTEKRACHIPMGNGRCPVLFEAVVGSLLLRRCCYLFANSLTTNEPYLTYFDTTAQWRRITYTKRCSFSMRPPTILVTLSVL